MLKVSHLIGLISFGLALILLSVHHRPVDSVVFVVGLLLCCFYFLGCGGGGGGSSGWIM
jgi:hypothetical protein